MSDVGYHPQCYDNKQPMSGEIPDVEGPRGSFVTTRSHEHLALCVYVVGVVHICLVVLWWYVG